MLQGAVDAGGELVLGDLKRENAILQPHLIDKCPLDCDLFIHESFGPVITVSRVNEGIQAMIDLVNSSEYTLTNSVYGSNIEDCMMVAKGMRSGSAHINGPTVSVIPFYGDGSNFRLKQIDLRGDWVGQVGTGDLVEMRASTGLQIFALSPSTRTRALCHWFTTTEGESARREVCFAYTWGDLMCLSHMCLHIKTDFSQDCRYCSYVLTRLYL
jgi:Aldehyde dehydrogenase family